MRPLHSNPHSRPIQALLIGGLLLGTVITQAPAANDSRIVALDYSSDYKYLAVGYQSGRLDIFPGTIRDFQAQPPLSTINVRPGNMPPSTLITLVALVWQPKSHELVISIDVQNISSCPGFLIVEDVDRKFQTAFDQLCAASALAWSPDGKQLATIRNGAAPGEMSAVQLWDSATWTKSSEFWSSPIALNSLAWRHDGKQLATAAVDGGVTLWSATTLKEINSLRAPGVTNAATTAPFTTISWNPNGSVAAIIDSTGLIEGWDAVTLKKLWQFQLTGQMSPPLIFAWSPNSLILAIRDHDQNTGVDTIQTINADTGKVIRTFALTDNRAISRMVFTPDMAAIIVGSEDGSLALISRSAQ